MRESLHAFVTCIRKHCFAGACPRLAPPLTQTPLCLHAEYALPHNARCQDFLGIQRSQLKHTADASMSEKQSMELQHADGSKISVHVQGADRHGDGNRWAIGGGGSAAERRCACVEERGGNGGGRGGRWRWAVQMLMLPWEV